MSLGDAVRTMLADVPGIAVIEAAAGCDSREIVARLRTATESGVVLLLIGPFVGALDRAMLSAATGPLAVELAPGARIGTIDIAQGAAPGDIMAAARFLAQARSTTGQILVIGPDC